MKLWTLLILGAVTPFLFASTIPSNIALICIFLTVICCYGLTPDLRLYCLFPLLFLTTTLSINQRVSERLPLSESRSSHQVTGVIGSLPVTSGEGVRFLFHPDEHVPPIPSKILVYWYKARRPTVEPKSTVPVIRAGERWQLQLVLRSPRGRVNFHGVDKERWYFTEGIGALAYVQQGDNTRIAGPDWFNLNHWRELMLDRLTQKAGDSPAFRVLAALAIADRRGLNTSDRTILSATGTGHLLAISGLHIGLAAVLGFYLGRLFLLFLFVSLKQRLAMALPWIMSWLAAFSYAALAGFGVSTQRALIMLTVGIVVLLCRRNVHPLQAWLIAMSLVLMADPFAPLRAGFWFSFIAVGILMILFVPLYGPIKFWQRMLLAQLGISLLMAPLGMYWFQQASLPGLLANLLAIPVVSLLTVPSILAGLILIWLPGPLSGWVLGFAGYSAHWLLQFLDFVSGLQPVSFSATGTPGLATTILAMLGAAILMLPRPVPGSWAGVLLVLPLLLPAGLSPGKLETQIDFLDVGQGLSVLLNTREYLLVYDTGPGNGVEGESGWDMVTGSIEPMIRATGKEPDLVIVSHADLDHAGGLRQLQSTFPNSRYLASLPAKSAGVDPCHAPGKWLAGELEFNILHPSSRLPYLGNNSSCVISVKGAGVSLLLSGDISRVVEQRLVSEGIEKHMILSAPHHGSSTSSSQELIDAVEPEWALISAAEGNRFGFPREDVLERYTKARVLALNTAECGGIRMTTDEMGGIRIKSARASRNAIWRWPATPECQ